MLEPVFMYVLGPESNTKHHPNIKVIKYYTQTTFAWISFSIEEFKS